MANDDKWDDRDNGKKNELPIHVKKELDDLIAPKSSTERVCGICGRRFQSGKALGGHMRIHFLKQKEMDTDDHQSHNNNNKKKNKTKTNRITINLLQVVNNQPQEIDTKTTNDDDRIPTCPLCFKTFHSLKSMYGHLRSHPDRYWRGSRPPMDIDYDSSTTRSSLMLTTSWPVTGTRGGRGTKPISENSRNLIEQDEDLLEGCTNLWHFSRGISKVHTPSSILIQRGSSSQAAAADVAVEADLILPEDEEESGNSLNESSEKFIKHLSNIHDICCNNNNNNNNKRKMVMDSDPCQKYMKNQAAAEDEKEKEYKCSICNKQFISYHGLGGHMSIHTRERNIGIRIGIGIGIDTRLYGCGWCKKIFSTAKALEGHKKCYRTSTTTRCPFDPREDNDNNASSRSHSQGHENQVVNLCFDLNEMPPLQEDNVNHRQHADVDDDDDDEDKYNDDDSNC